MMLRFLRLFRAFRDLEESIHNSDEARRDWQSRADEYESALRDSVSANLAVERELESSQAQFQVEQSRRISAEAIASERQHEIDRLLSSLSDFRADLRSVTSERIKSVDAINLKLMEAKIPEQPVDFTQHHPAVMKTRTQGITDIRNKYYQIDMAILEQQQKGFPKRLRPGGPIRPNDEKVPTLAEIAATDITQETAH